MHPAMRLGPVSLKVRDIGTMLLFYSKDLGLTMMRQEGNTYELGAGPKPADPMVILNHDANSRVPPANSAGLYHFAILLPNRKSLGAAYVSLGRAGVVFDGYADHLVSEALYLMDPEGNGIEIYADKDRSQWQYDTTGRIRMATEPLDIDSILRELGNVDHATLKAIPEGARIGHIHLKVTELKRSCAFYNEELGLDVMSHWGSAAFLSVAGYHHHIGMNTWESLMGPRSQAGSSGLDHFNLTIPDADFVQKLGSRFSQTARAEKLSSSRLLVRDPDGIRFVISS